MVQWEHDILADHFTVNLKAINPDPATGNGIYFASLLQSVAPRLALGTELIHQRGPGQTASDYSYFAKLTSFPSLNVAANALTPGQPALPPPFNPSWIGTLSVSAMRTQASYYHRLSDKVDVAADLTVENAPPTMMSAGGREATATLGAKYDFRLATFRAQMDSNWKVGMQLEQRWTPQFALTVGGEIDHAKNTSRFGLGVQVDFTSM